MEKLSHDTFITNPTIFGHARVGKQLSSEVKICTVVNCFHYTKLHIAIHRLTVKCICGGKNLHPHSFTHQSPLQQLIYTAQVLFLPPYLYNFPWLTVSFTIHWSWTHFLNRIIGHE